jgi:hypothetical protein
MDKDFSRYQKDAPVSADALANLTALAQQFDAEKRKLEEMRAEAAEQQKLCLRIEFSDLPKQMRLCRQKKITTDDGRTIEVAPVYKCKIREGMTEAALDWLARHGEAGSIKYRVGRAFSMKEQRRAQAMASRIRGQGVDPIVEKKVEPSTLKRIYRERVEEGLAMPQHLFEFEVLERASVK